jgi:hypothetical protein
MITRYEAAGQRTAGLPAMALSYQGNSSIASPDRFQEKEWLNSGADPTSKRYLTGLKNLLDKGGKIYDKSY